MSATVSSIVDSLLSPIPEQATPIHCFGDIHGHRAAADSAFALSAELGTRAVFLGDYIDRGPDSGGVLQVLMAASRRHPDWVFLLGNHYWMLEEILEGRRHAEGFDERTFSETLPRLSPAELPGILEWLRERPAFFRSRFLLFVHGGFTDAAIPIERVPTDELVRTYGISEDWQGATVVRGHALVEQVAIKNRDINVNTRCGFGGHLTGLLLDPGSARCLRSWQISEAGEILETTDSLLRNP
jgi:serine/threonine protein phosphatase 1